MSNAECRTPNYDRSLPQNPNLRTHLKTPEPANWRGDMLVAPGFNPGATVVRENRATGKFKSIFSPFGAKWMQFIKCIYRVDEATFPTCCLALSTACAKAIGAYAKASAPACGGAIDYAKAMQAGSRLYRDELKSFSFFILFSKN